MPGNLGINTCPFCKKVVNETIIMNCMQCADCSQKTHIRCLLTEMAKKGNRNLADDILYCPTCKNNNIKYCNEVHLMLDNEAMKHAVSIDPNIKGGKRKNHKKSKKSIKNRRSRKTRKTRK
jgi:hypothetical protein